MLCNRVWAVFTVYLLHVAASPAVKRSNSDAGRPAMSIKTTEPKVETVVTIHVCIYYNWYYQPWGWAGW